MKKILISDFTIKEVPHGGSEWVNQVLIDKFNLEFKYSNRVNGFNKSNLYIISNVSLMNPSFVKQIHKLNYIIIENDYKICQSRHPWIYPDSIIPINERTNYEMYRNAKAVFVQTTDHLNVYKSNGVEGNFINLHSSIWSESDLNMLTELLTLNESKNKKQAIYSTNNFIKNTNGNIKYCVEKNIEYELIPNMENRRDFLQKLSECQGLVFYPIARETFCRLVVEAKCLGLEVTTSKNYGASKEEWFDELSGKDMIEFLRKQTENNLTKISEYINKK
jgi:hypothetical protein